jgi:hypothetical protein
VFPKVLDGKKEKRSTGYKQREIIQEVRVGLKAG